MVLLLAVEPHRLHRAAAAVTITPLGGHRHDRVRVAHCHHTRTGRARARSVLLPRRFIEAIDAHDRPTH